MNDYPQTVNECLDDSMTFEPDVITCLKEFKTLRPWRGSLPVRQDKFCFLHDGLCLAYQRYPRLVFDVPDPELEHGNGSYNHLADTITLHGKLSVITYLHEFAHAVFGHGEQSACRWSINLFRCVFPKEYARLTPKNHMLISNP